MAGKSIFQSDNLETSKKVPSRASTLNVLRRLKSTPSQVGIRFPKVPDMLLHSDENALAKRQQQLQDYLNSILQYHVYRNHHETVSTHMFTLQLCTLHMIHSSSWIFWK